MFTGWQTAFVILFSFYCFGFDSCFSTTRLSIKMIFTANQLLSMQSVELALVIMAIFQFVLLILPCWKKLSWFWSFSRLLRCIFILWIVSLLNLNQALNPQPHKQQPLKSNIKPLIIKMMHRIQIYMHWFIFKDVLFFKQITNSAAVFLDSGLTLSLKIHNIRITSQRPYRLEA